MSGDLWAGAEVMAYSLLKGLTRRTSMEIVAILLNRGRLFLELQRHGIKVHLMDEKEMPFLVILRAIRNLLNKLRPDVIHGHRYKENIIAHWASRSLKKAILVSTQHGLPELYTGKSGIKNNLIMKYNFYVLSRRFHKVVLVSRDIHKFFIEQLGFSKKQVTVIHNGIEIPDIVIEKKNNKKFSIGSCGRFVPVKDYPLIVEIAKEMTLKSKHISFEIAGEGPEWIKVKDLVERYSLENFYLKKHLDDISTFYKGLSLYLNTSIHEGIPMSVLESMAHGLPIVAPNVGGFSEIIEDGVQGYLIEDRDPKKFSGKCIKLFEDKKLLKKMSEAAREKVVQNFSVDKMIKQYYDLYEKLTG